MDEFNAKIKSFFITGVIFCLIIFGAKGLNGFYKSTYSSNPNFQSSNPKIQYSRIFRLLPLNNYTKIQPSSYFDVTTFYDALKIDKPILFFTYTSFCPVSQHIKDLVYPIGTQYSNYYTFVVFTPPSALTSYRGDPINNFIAACKTPICVFDRKKNFLLSFDADINTNSDEITAALNDFLERSGKL